MTEAVYGIPPASSSTRRGSLPFLFGIVALLVIAIVHLFLVLNGDQTPFAPVALVVPIYGFGFVWHRAIRFLRAKVDAFAMRADEFALDALVSFMAFAVLSSVLAVSWNLTPRALAMVVDGGTLLGAACLLLAQRASSPAEGGRLSPGGIVPLVAVVVGSVVLFLVWRQNTPLPVVNGWDWITYVVPVESMMTKGGFPWLLAPPFPASAGIPYPGMFWELVAGLSLYLGVTPLQVVWWGPLLLTAAFMVLTYLLVLRYSRSPWLAALVAFIGIFISSAEAETVRSSLYLAADVVAQIFFLLLLTWYAYDASPRNERSLVAITLVAFFGVFYFYAILPTFPFVLVMIVGSRRVPILRTPFRLYLAAWIPVMGFFAALAVLSPTSNEDLAQFVNPSVFPEGLKAVILFGIYYPPFWIPFAAALAAYWPRRHAISLEPLSLTYFAVGALVLLIAYWFPVWATYRLEFYLRTFVLVFLASFGLVWTDPLPKTRPSILDRIGSRLRRPRRLSDAVRRHVALLVLFLIPALALYPLFDAYAHSYSAYYSADEYRVGEWIQGNLPSDAYLATDPGTGYFLRGLAFRNASRYFILADGRAPWDSSTLYPNINEQLHAAFLQPTPKGAHDALQALGFSHLFIVVSSRTPLWLAGGVDTWSAHPDPTVNDAAVAAFFANPWFHLVYRSGDVYVFGLGP